MSPYRSKLPAGRDGFAQLLRAEWTKLTTVRRWVISIGAVAVVVVALSFAGASGSHSGICTGTSPSTLTCTTGHPPVATGPGGEAVVDTFTFVHRPMVGNGTLTVEVNSLTGAHATSGAVGVSPSGQLHANLRSGLAPWAKAGLILTAKTTQGSAYAAVLVTGSHGVQMQYDYTHSIPGARGAVTAASPRWLRLSRSGDVVTAYDSSDGSHWTEIKEVRLSSLPSRVQVGLFVTSPVFFPSGSDNGYPSMATASFDKTTVRGDLPGRSWAGEVIGGNGPYPTLPGVSKWHQQGSGAFTVSGSGDIAPLVGGGIFGNNAGASILVGALAGLIVLLVLATVFVTSEYRRGLIQTTFVATPRRSRVLAAKAVVVGAVAFFAGAVGTAAAELVSRHVLTANGNYLFPLSTLGEARVILGSGLVLAAAAVLALSLGAALRHSVGAVVTGIVLLVLPFILGTALPAGPANWLMRLTPTAGFAVQGIQPRSVLVASSYTPVNGYYPLGPWVGLAVLCAYAAAAFAAARWSIRRRDA